MTTIELIKIRTGKKVSHQLLETLMQLAKEADRSTKECVVKFYKHGLVTGDFAYFIFWKEEAIETEGSTLGLKIRKSLESMGLVDYSIWRLLE